MSHVDWDEAQRVARQLTRQRQLDDLLSVIVVLSLLAGSIVLLLMAIETLR